MNPEDLAKEIANFLGLKAEGDKVILDTGTLVLTPCGWKLIILPHHYRIVLKKDYLVLIKSEDEKMRVEFNNLFVIPILSPKQNYLKVIRYDELYELFPYQTEEIANCEVGYEMLKALRYHEDFMSYFDGGIIDFGKGLLQPTIPGLGYAFTFTPDVITVKNCKVKDEFEGNKWKVEIRVFRKYGYIILKYK